MDFIPIDPEDEIFKPLLDSFGKFPFSFVKINNPGDYANESIVFKANEDIGSLNHYMLIYSVEDMETGIPDYSKCRLLTFDEIDLQKGSLLQIYTRPGEDSSTIEFETNTLNTELYWGLPEPIWHIPHSSYELIKTGDSIGGGLIG